MHQIAITVITLVFVSATQNTDEHAINWKRNYIRFQMWESKENIQQEDREQDGKKQVNEDAIEKEDRTLL
jgi:hypothetical protein